MNIKLANKTHTNSKLSGKAKFLALTILTLSLLSNQASYAAESRGEKSDITHFTKMAKQGRHNEINHMIKKLQLDAQQQSDIKVIKKAAKSQNKALFDSLKQYHSELELLIRANFLDEQAITNLHNTYQVDRAQIALAKAKTRHAVLQVLTEQQKDKWFAFIAKRHDRKMKRNHE